MKLSAYGNNIFRRRVGNALRLDGESFVEVMVQPDVDELWGEPANGWIALHYMCTKLGHKPVIKFGVGDTICSIEQNGVYVRTTNNIEPIMGTSRDFEGWLLITYSNEVYTIVHNGVEIVVSDTNVSWAPSLTVDLLGGVFLEIINDSTKLPLELQSMVVGKTGWGL